MGREEGQWRLVEQMPAEHEQGAFSDYPLVVVERDVISAEERERRAVAVACGRGDVARFVKEELFGRAGELPMFRALAERWEVEEQARCPQGHAMARCDAGAEGLASDEGCGLPIKRVSSWWCCEACDYDVSMM